MDSIAVWFAGITERVDEQHTTRPTNGNHK
jgi:hypothetical protein